MYGNVKTDWNISQVSDGTTLESGTSNFNVDTGAAPLSFAFYGEYLYPVVQKLKVGGGVGYVVQGNIPLYIGDKTATDANNNDITYSASLLPIYLTVQFHPLSALEGLFVKGNIGLTIFSSFAFSTPDLYDGASKSLTGKMYYGLSTGYEFASGFICELAFSVINYSVEYKYDYYTDRRHRYTESDTETWNFSYRRLGLIAGYKF